MRKLLLSALMVSPVLMQQAAAQNRSISGRVTDSATGQGLPGVTVLVKGTTVGASTNADGSYSLNVPATATTLSFSFIGYATIDKPIGDASSINADLSASARDLGEVVVTGLGTSVARANLANNVATISGAELIGRTRPSTVDGAMYGKLSGAVISQNSGAPGGGFSVQLRGPSSINGSSEPLYIVDGVYANNNSYDSGRAAGPFSNAGGGRQDGATNRLSDLNPDDIENIEVLKGSSAAAIYGQRANAGVIIITTKKGKIGQTKISVRQDFGVTTILRKFGKSDFTDAKIDQVFGGDADEKAALAAANASGKIYDYEDELFGNTGFLSNTSVNVSGGGERVRFFVSGSRTDEGAIQKKLGFQRNSVRANVSTDITKNWDFSLNSNYVNSSNQRGFSNNANTDATVPYLVAVTPSYADLFPVNGVYPRNPYAGENPLALRDRGINNEKTNRFLQSFTSNLYFFRNDNSTLRLAASGGVDFALTDAELYLPEDLQSQSGLANPGASRYSKNKQLNTNLQALLIHTLQVSKLGFTTSLGTTRFSQDLNVDFVQGEGLQPKLKNPARANRQTLSQAFQSSVDLGYSAQEEINFNDQIVGTVGLRADQSNLNADPSKLYFFPHASLALNVANFDFWPAKDQVNQFKLRAAYGETGGVPQFGSYFTPLNSVVIDTRLGLRNSTTIGNDRVSPERAAELEGGVDLAFLNNKLTLEATVYRKKVTDLLFTYTLAPSTGVLNVSAFPVGDLVNKGIELGLGVLAVDQPNFRYHQQTQFWFNRSEVTRLIVPTQSAGPGFASLYGQNFLKLGESPTRWFGNPLVDGIPTAYQESQPKYQVTFANDFTFLKKIDFSFLIHVKQGGYNSTLTQNAYDQGGTSPDYSDPYTYTDEDGNVVNSTLGYERFNGPLSGQSSNYIQDASYMKLREVSLYYTFSKDQLGATLGKSVQRIKVGVSGNNLLVVTPYKGGFDPEVSNFGSRPVGGNQDLYSFPSARRMFLHLNFDF
ncbi:SusC/RagA family TonB-linked outer membrane protein [Hymenobacter canadensis]|uniref:SusC/RagA family TonB-linked outer membrane protein n=1 Tax=Hymenobacter canadensis TaxID=2999067 RepID=A0ABY7LIF5_9BACT|nr:SusC/RagA family TonB-linked outer membrane protein [Hymenobacter canadensis]WBA40232.1 SusC/RagA family TonB-linked outer membrane protein [Hymenobacter canadensis]